MRILISVSLPLLAAALLYVCGYFVAAQKFEGYAGSAPIDDPTWSRTIQVEPAYRFFGASFWQPAHRLDRAVRPRYWSLTIRSAVSEGAVVIPAGQPVFLPRTKPSLLHTIFPTLYPA